MSRFDLAEVEAAEKAVEDEKKLFAETVESASEAVDFLDRVATATPEARNRVKSRVEEARAYLKDLRGSKDPVVRRAAYLVLIGHEFRLPISSLVEINRVIAGMVSDGLLTIAQSGKGFEISGQKYVVSSNAMFGEVEEATIHDLAARLVARVRYGVKSTAHLDPCDLITGPDGTYMVYVPAERANGDPKNWRPGGPLTVEKARGLVRPIDVSGKIGSAVRQAMDLGVALSVASLNDEEPPFYKGDDFERNRKCQLVWYLLVRGINFARWLKEVRGTPSLLTPQDFFLRAKTGLCLVDLGEAWKWEEGEEILWVPRPILLVERATVDDGTVVRIVDKAPYLTDFFSECTDVYPEGERFGGLPMRLGAAMRAGYRRARDQRTKVGSN